MWDVFGDPDEFLDWQQAEQEREAEAAREHAEDELWDAEQEHGLELTEQQRRQAVELLVEGASVHFEPDWDEDGLCNACPQVTVWQDAARIVTRLWLRDRPWQRVRRSPLAFRGSPRPQRTQRRRARRPVSRRSSRCRSPGRSSDEGPEPGGRGALAGGSATKRQRPSVARRWAA